MPIQRGPQEVIKRYRGSQEILASYRGGQKVYSSMPIPVLFAEFPSGDLLRNSGSAGGQFTLAGASPGARPPYGAWIPEAGYLVGQSSEVTPGGCTVMGWFKSSKALTGPTPVSVGDGGAYVAFAHTSDAYSSELKIQAGNASYVDLPISGAPAHLGAWIHLAASLEPSGGQTRDTAYVNGEQALTGTVDGAMSPSSSYMYIGLNWEGDAGRVRLFSGGALTPAQVASFYDAERSIYPVAGAPAYRATGTIGRLRLARDVWTTLASHTVTRSVGSAGLLFNASWDATTSGSYRNTLRIRRNGATVTSVDTAAPSDYSLSYQTALDQGDVIYFDALTRHYSEKWQTITKGDWSVLE